MPMSMPISEGRFSSGADMAMMVMAPFMSPEPPMPATARLTMSILDELARPQRREPISKTKRNARNVH